MRTLIVLVLSVCFLAGCSNLRFPGVYRIDIPQGNFVTEDMLLQLEPGMTPEQVQYVLGTPTLVDPFTPNTWFYPMTLQPGRGEKVTQEIIVYFTDGVFSRYEGDVIDDFRSQVNAPKDRELQQRADEQRRDSEQRR